MQPYRIDFVENRSATTYLPMYDAFLFKPKGKLKVLQEAAWKFLKKCGVLEQAYEPTIKVTRHVVDPDSFMKKILLQRKYLLRDFYRHGQTLIIGSEDYADLMCSPEMVPHAFNFQATFGLDKQIMGLKVVVVPWMRGMVVMPD